MPKRYKGEPVELSADEITAWAEAITGMPVKEIAERHNIALRTAYEWIERAKERIQHPPDIEAMRQGLYSLFPDALDALKHSLKVQKDGQIAIRLLQGISALVDRKEIDVHDTRQLTSEQLRDELRRELGPVISGEAEKTERDNPRTTPS